MIGWRKAGPVRPGTVQVRLHGNCGWRAKEHKMICYRGRHVLRWQKCVEWALWFVASARNLEWWLEMATDCEWRVGSVREEGSICTHAAKQRKWQTKYGLNKVLEIPHSNGQRSNERHETELVQNTVTDWGLRK